MSPVSASVIDEIRRDVPTAELAGLARVLELCQPLMASTRETLRVFPVNERAAAVFDQQAMVRCNEVLAEIGTSYGLTVPQFVWPAPDQASSLEVALSNFCDLELVSWQSIAECSVLAVQDGMSGAPAVLPERRYVEAAGLPRFESFSCGDPGGEAIVLVPPCGVPAALFRPWLNALSSRHLVVTYENPYLFGEWDALPTPSGAFEEETAFVGALLEEYGIARAHLIGICGGAPVALAAAAEFGPRVASLTVLHPDLNFGAEVPRTPFQTQFQGLLAGAGAGLGRAREVLDLFLDPNMLFGVPAKLAPFVLYPYGDLELFHRYAKMNHGLMAYDANDAARRIDQRLLIATSRTDRMTHPATAHHLHQLVDGSSLSERDSGSHHDILVPDQEMFEMIQQFVDAGAESARQVPARQELALQGGRA